MAHAHSDGGRNRTRSPYRRNSSRSNSRSRALSVVMLERNRRRRDRDRGSLSESRTRSSSRTTSGNPDSSLSRSSSPPSEEPRRKPEEEPPHPRRRRFLQRWDDERSSDDARPSNPRDSDPPEAAPELPYVYQQPEFIRISQDIIRKCDAEHALTEFLKTIDRNESVDLSLVGDQQLRKKLRHLAKALYLEREGSEFRRPPECKISLLEVFNELLPFIRAKANAQGPYQRKVVHQEPEPEPEEPEPEAKRKLTREEAAELLSLREMHEQGFFVDYENVQKEFVKKQKQVDLWGKTAEEQRALLASSDEKEDDERPWNTFDRERDLLGPSEATAHDYERLLKSAKNLEESFHVASKTTSFI